MYLVYEDKERSWNLLACQRMADDNTRVYDAWPHKWQVDILNRVHVRSVATRPNHYAFPIGLYHGPDDWTGPSFIPESREKPTPTKELFEYIPQPVLDDAQRGRVLLILDSSHEGNNTPHLWPWFYKQLDRFAINPQNVVFMAGDQDAAHSHNMWRGNRRPHINVLPTMHWRHRVPKNLVRWHRFDPAMQRSHLYNCLNRAPHLHRKFCYLALHDTGLLDSGLVSMPDFEWHERTPALDTLPRVVDDPDFTRNKSFDINQGIYDDTWFTLVTESRIDKVFFSEKIFKPMLCHSPFLVVAKQGYLRRLRDRGFATFPMLWDESYDDEPNIHKRIAMIMQQIKSVASLADKTAWLESASAALEHNHRTAMAEYTDTDDHDALVKLWKAFDERCVAQSSMQA